jgi:2-polyprenyl-6-methoxyphenol hydroxylase-like FAD-dependent oxidoreductase
MYHPDLQTVLLERAAKAGADVRRGVTVEGIDLSTPNAPRVTFAEHGAHLFDTARLVVGADGRSSRVRAWGGFETRRDPDRLTMAGTIVEGTPVPDDAVHFAVGAGVASFIAPLGNKRARTYFVYPDASGRRKLTGKDAIPRFLEASRSTGIPPEWLTGVDVVGPLAEFEGADHWVDSPSKPGLALIGDAAASTDPSWGCGLSLTLLDVENLAGCLEATEDWDAALARYARQHDDTYGKLHRVLGWMTDLFWTPGPAGDARRGRVFPRMALDPSGYPDSIGQGPFGPSDERARKLILGEDDG